MATLPTAENLYAGALHYLARYATSAEGLRTVLRRRLLRAERAGIELNRPELELTIDAIIQKLQQQGILNDQLFAEMRVASLRRAGQSSYTIKQKLRAKGIGPDMLEGHLDADDDAEAAIKLCQKKRFGAWRTHANTPERIKKELAALLRAGFSFSAAKAALAFRPEE